MTAERIVMGVVTGAHGVRGLVRVKSFTADPADLTAYGPLTDAAGRTEYALTLKGEVKGQLLAAIAGCTDRNAAEALRGTQLYLARALLPETEDGDEFYHADLIGLSARDAAGVELGRVRAVFDFGSGDVLEVLDADGRAVLYPFTRTVVPEIDLAAGTLTVLPPEEASTEREGEPEA
jgi:16S rRNA processing protein RimM